MKSLTKFAEELALDFSMLFDDSISNLVRNDCDIAVIDGATEFGESKNGCMVR